MTTTETPAATPERPAATPERPYERVALPAPELVPHYNRGRTYVPPAEGGASDA